MSLFLAFSLLRGKKFNSWKEDCIGEDYLGIRKYRFYIKCVTCSREITFKTDPENGDYELETGASRNFESWADKQATEEEHKKAREEEEKSDSMKQLENRTLDSKIELEIMDALDEIKAVNRRHENIDTAEVLRASAAARREREKNAAGGASGSGSAATGGGALGTFDEDEALIASIQFGGPKIRRLEDDGDEDETESSTKPVGEGGFLGGRKDVAASGEAPRIESSEQLLEVKPRKKRVKGTTESRAAGENSSTKLKKQKKKQNDPGKANKVSSEPAKPAAAAKPADASPKVDVPAGSGGPALGGLNLLGAYASSSDSDGT